MQYQSNPHGTRLSGAMDSAEEEVLGRAYDRQVLARLASYLAPYWFWMVVAAVGMVAHTLARVASPWLIGLAITRLTQSRDPGALAPVVIAYLSINLVGWLAQYGEMRATAVVGHRVLLDLRTRMFRHLQRLSLSFYDQNQVGRVMSRLQNDVNQLQELMAGGFLGTLGDLLSLAGVVFALFSMDVQLALITITVLPLLVGMMVLWQGYARRAFLRIRRAIAVVNAGLQENISGVRVIQSLRREDENFQRFDRINRAHLDANLQAGRLGAAILPAVEVMVALATALVVVFGGRQVLAGTLGLGVLVAFVLYIQTFFDPIRNLSMQYSLLQSGMASGRRVFELLDLAPEPDAEGRSVLQGDVKFENVTFSYGGEPVLRDINLHIRAGEVVALVGPTGAGKTTLANLLCRSYEVTQGRVTIGGVDIRTQSREALAAQRGMVLQEPFLFLGTLRENIAYGRAGATEEEIVQAARTSGADVFIQRLEKGYDTEVQERGENFSVGQRQLICLARAIVGRPPLLILDEATASLDPQTEMAIEEALPGVLRGSTALIIAHRLSTVRRADRIIVLDQGRIVEQGNHQELLARKGLYAGLYSLGSRRSSGLLPGEATAG